MKTAILFCIECNKSTPTDFMYIKKALNRWYIVDNGVVINKIHMKSISRYNDKKTIKQIKEYKRCSKNLKVIYCVDTDDYDCNPDQKILFDKISQYCSSHDYDLVFFCRDVEHVFLGKQVNKTSKKKIAASFANANLINKVSEESLTSLDINDSRSNFLNVLDKYLERKRR